VQSFVETQITKTVGSFILPQNAHMTDGCTEFQQPRSHEHVSHDQKRKTHRVEIHRFWWVFVSIEWTNMYHAWFSHTIQAMCNPSSWRKCEIHGTDMYLQVSLAMQLTKMSYPQSRHSFLLHFVLIGWNIHRMVGSAHWFNSLLVRQHETPKKLSIMIFLNFCHGWSCWTIFYNSRSL